MISRIQVDKIHMWARQNLWLYYFAIFNRIALAMGFLPSGFVKVNGERFTDLHNFQPMGRYLEAFYHTGYYYTFVGVLQMIAAILLLIPRTATLGAVLYFPVILNICILSYSVRFDGSLLTAPLMVMANLYLLCWDWHKIKYLLPFNYSPPVAIPHRKKLSKKFPWKFFLGVVVSVFLVLLLIIGMYANIFMPRNTIEACNRQCESSINIAECLGKCDCIHLQGLPMRQCLERNKRSLQSVSNQKQGMFSP